MQPIKEVNEDDSIYQQRDNTIGSEKIIIEQKKPRIIINTEKSESDINDQDERNSRYTQNNNSRFTQVSNDNIMENPLNYKEENKNNSISNNTNLTNNNKLRKNSKSNEKPKIKEYSFKIIIVGDISVGKTSIINRFIENKFTEGIKSTLVNENLKKKIRIDNSTIVTLNIWDTIGDERFRILTHQFYQDSHGALLIFDITNKETFNKLEIWIKDIIQNTPPDCILMIIGNKYDLNENRKISYDEANILSQRFNISYYEVSAKNGNNIALAFEQLTYRIIDKQREEENNVNRYLRKDQRNTIGLEDGNNNNSNKKCC
jgi:small GTP-binding protein